jgi:hypothetical protein
MKLSAMDQIEDKPQESKSAASQKAGQVVHPH